MAIDDLLPDHIAVVVNSADQTVSTIDLTTGAVTSTVSVAIGPTAGSPAGIAPVPFSIGINSLTHRAVVAYQSFNEATILDLSTRHPECRAADRWRSDGSDRNRHEPGGSGGRAVELGHRHAWGRRRSNNHDRRSGPQCDQRTDVARTPAVVASLALSTTGVGINGETHQVIFHHSQCGKSRLRSACSTTP